MTGKEAGSCGIQTALRIAARRTESAILYARLLDIPTNGKALSGKSSQRILNPCGDITASPMH